MLLHSLHLHNFRNYEDARFTFCPGVNIVHGDNAQGKTNLLEAIYFLITGHSFRTTQISDLIRHECPYFYLEAIFIRRGIEQKLRIAFDGKERKVIYNNTVCQSASDLLGLLHGIVITPDDAALVKGSPQVRRHFLDLHIAQHTPLYVHRLTRYNRAMRQRNALLKIKNGLSIESWEHEMANAAAYLVLQRAAAVADLVARGIDVHHGLSSTKEKLGLHYKSQGPSEGSTEELKHYFLEQYAKLRRREMELGSTLTGPHKDDLLITINGADARYFASEGQQRSCTSALRLAEWLRLKELSDELPLMLIDDIGTSLDEQRRANFLAQLPALGQVFISSTEKISLACGRDEKHFQPRNGVWNEVCEV